MTHAWKLLTLIAVLLLPLGMTTPAAATQRHAASMPNQGCPDHAPNHGSKAAFAECTMACSAALPAADLGGNEPLIVLCEPVQSETATKLHGLQPETETPPPKSS